eukprot:5849325-Lingulodinium_polyedra.AAC.1
MSADLRRHDAPWESDLILVDEAGQATEPMTIIPLQVAARDAHAIFIGDHQQLAPTVLSKDAGFQ